MSSDMLRPGDQLPTVRQVAVDLSINPNTVSRAYKELEIRGILSTQQGTGAVVNHDPNGGAGRSGEAAAADADGERSSSARWRGGVFGNRDSGDSGRVVSGRGSKEKVILWP